MISIFLNFLTVFGCDIQYRERSYYLNEGEFFQIYLEQIFKEENLTFICRGCSNDTQLSNALNQIGNNSSNDHIFLSISSNITHFVALTSDQSLVFYIWLKQVLQIQNDVIYIDELANQLTICINVIYFEQHSLVLDCYDELNLYIYQIKEKKLKIIYQITSIRPQETKIKQFKKQNNTYILYGQFYDNYQILTLFTQDKDTKNLINSTTWHYGLQNFIISDSYTRQNFIYIQYNSTTIIQITINDQNQFQILASLNQQSSIYAIQVYRSINLNSQCDQLIIVQQPKPEYWNYWACEGNFYQFQNKNLNITIGNHTKYQIFINDQFFLFQQNASISVSSTQTPDYKYIEKKVIFDHFNHFYSLYIFNPFTNQLFEFGQIIQVYQVDFPQLRVNLTKNYTQKYIQIYSRDISLNYKQPCSIYLNFSKIQSDDTNIYIQYNFKPINQYVLLNTSFYDILTGIQGPQLYYNGYAYNGIGYFTDESLRKSNYGLQIDYYISQIFYIQQLNRKQCLFITGVYKLIIEFTLCCHKPCNQTIYNLTQGQNQIQDIQIAYNLNGEIIVVLNQGTQKSLMLFIITLESLQLNYSYQNITLTTFIDYQVSFNCLIIVTVAQEIQLISLDGQPQFFLNKTNFQYYFKDLDSFTPKDITINQQYLSSILSINNNNKVLLMLITSNIELIPIQRIDVLFEIRLVQQIWDDLVLIHYCNYARTHICFDVWNVENPFNPRYEKKLRPLKINQFKTISSDNLFMYIQTESNEILVYNPFQTTHVSPWTSFHLNQSYFTSTTVEGFSLIINYNQLYELSPEILMKFTPNTTYFQQDYVQKYNYYFQVGSQQNYSSQYKTNNITLNLISTYTNIFINYLVIDVKQRDYFILTANEINNQSQVFGYNLTNLNPNSTINECSCNIQNPINQYTNKIFNSTYTFLVIVNNQFVLLNNQNATILFGTTYNFNINNLNCNATTSYLNYFYLICQSLTNSIIQSFELLNSSITQKQNYILPLFKNITLIRYELQHFFILALDQNNDKNIYIYNSFSQKQCGFITNCDTCYYFFLTNFLNTTEVGLIALFYSCKNQIRYKIGQYNYTTRIINFDDESRKLQISEIFEQKNEYPMEIQILKVIDYEMILLITATNFCSVIVSMMYSVYQQQFFIQQYLTTIPPLGNYYLVNSTFTNQTLILMYFQPILNPQYVYAFYQFENISSLNIQTPMKMIGAITFNEPQLVGVTSPSNQQSQQILAFYNNFARIYNLSTLQIYCNINIGLFAKQKQFQFKIIGNNSFYSNYSILTLNYQRSTEIYLYLLIIVIIICLFFCFIVYRQREEQSKSSIHAAEFQFEL